MSSSATAVKANDSTNPTIAATAAADGSMAYGLLRLGFGINIMIHGVVRLLAPPGAFLNYLTHYFEKTPLMPQASLPIFASVIPWLEGGFGLLLVLGLFTRISLIGGTLTMIGLVLGTNLAQDWNIAGLQLIYLFIYYYLLVNRAEQNRYSIDGMMGKN
ncbi:MAG: DoxX family membrane protein [Bryobacteraceae bacterium]